MNMRIISTALLAVGLVLVSPAHGQDEPIATQLFSVTLKDGSRWVVFQPVAASSTTLVVQGPVHLKSGSDGKLDVRVSDPVPGKKTSNVICYLVFGSDEQLGELAEQIRATARNATGNEAELLQKYRNIDARQLILPPINNLKVADGSTGFKLPASDGATAYGNVVPLVSEVSSEVAKDFGEGLRDGRIIPVISVDMELAAKKIESEMLYNAKVAAEKITAAYESLTGQAGDLVQNVGPNGFSTHEPHVTRDQKNSILATISSGLNITLVIVGNPTPEQQALLQQANTVFGEAFVPTFVHLEDDFEGQIREKLTIDRRDSAPGELQKVAASLDKFFAGDEQTYSFQNTDASLKVFGVFGASGRHTYSRSDLKKVMESVGWKFAQEQQHWVPKGLEIYRVDRERLSHDKVANFFASAASRGRLRVSDVVDGSRLASINRQTVPFQADHYGELVQLCRERAVQKHDLDDCQQKLEEKRSFADKHREEILKALRDKTAALLKYRDHSFWYCSWTSQRSLLDCHWSSPANYAEHNRIYNDFRSGGKTGPQLVAESKLRIDESHREFNAASNRHKSAQKALTAAEADIRLLETKTSDIAKKLRELDGKIDPLVSPKS
jgi:hypothetical protein